MKKSIALFLSILLLNVSAQSAELISNGTFERVTLHKPATWTLYGGASYVPSTWDAPSANLVKNGDFEIVQNDSFAEWDHYRPANILLSTERVNGGNLSVGIKGKDGACVSQYIQLTPDTDYLMSAWVYAEKGAVPEMHLNYYTAENIICGSGDSMGAVPSECEWHYISILVHTPSNASGATLYCSASGTDAYVYYDDISLGIISEANGFSLETDSIFYYADASEGRATVTASGNTRGKEVTFRLCHQNEVIEEKIVSFSENQATYVFPLSLLSQLKKEYVLTASVTAEDGTEENFSERIYKYNRPTALGDDGIYKDTDGDPFYPVIGYHVEGEDYLRMPEIGVNVVQVDSDVTKEQLDAFEKIGIKAMICLYLGCPASMKPGGHPQNIENTIKVVTAYGDHPAVFGWAAMDEPFWNTKMDIMKIWIHDTYKIVRDLDDVHPVYICQAPAQNYALAEKYCDILACDPYSYNDDTAKTTTQTEMAMLAAKGKKPVYTIVQTYSSNPYWFPSADVIRAQIRRALASGAKGVGCYSISDSTYGGEPIYNETETWSGLKIFANEELQLLFELYTSENFETITESGNASENHAPYFKGWKSKDNTKIYIDAHNRSIESETTITVPLGDIGGYTVRKAGEETTTLDSGDFTVTLGKGASGVYVLSLDTPILLFENESENSIQAKQTETSCLLAETLSAQMQSGENHYVSLAHVGAGVMQRMDALKPYTSYTLSLAYKTSVKNSLKLTVDFGVNGGSGFLPWSVYCSQNNIEYLEREASYTEIFGNAGKSENEWKILTVDFYTPKCADAISLGIEAVLADPYAGIDNVSLKQNGELNILKNGSLDYLKDESTLCGGWLAYDTYMSSYKNVTLRDGYIEMRENTEDTSANLRQYVYLYAGETYALSFDFLGDEPEVSVWYSDKRANTVAAWGKKASNWKRYTMYFTVEETNRYYLWFGGRNTKGIYSYDNIKLAPYTHKGTKLFKEVGTLVSGGSVKNVCIPFSEAMNLKGNVYAWAENPDNHYTLIVSTYGKNNELIYFDFAKSGMVTIPSEKVTENVKAFLWKDLLQPVPGTDKAFKGVY